MNRGWRDRLSSEAKRRGGRVIYRLAQGEQPLRGMIGLHGQTVGGVCRGLVEKWLVMGEAFWPWLCPDGKVNAAAVGNIMTHHVNPGMLYGNEAFERGDGAYSIDYFRFRGLIVVPPDRNIPSVAGNLFTQIGELIRQEPPNEIALFSLWMYVYGGTDGHALGMRTTDRGTLRFYDPNLGEIEFDSRDGFKDWMENAFVKVKPYAVYDTVKCTKLRRPVQEA